MNKTNLIVQAAQRTLDSQIKKPKVIRDKEPMLKTSIEWYEQDYLPNGTIIYDPDGWDRTNYQYSFYEEKITKEEFETRLYKSTVSYSKK